MDPDVRISPASPQTDHHRSAAMQPNIAFNLFPIFMLKHNLHIPSSTAVWHLGLGHAAIVKLKNITAIKLVIDASFDHICSVFPMAKQTRNSFSYSTSHADQNFHTLHCDVWGPFEQSTQHGFTFLLTIVGDRSRGVWAFQMKHKSETFYHIQNFILLVENRFQNKVKILRSDLCT